MATFVLIHGGGDVGWHWHLVEAELRSRGHDSVAGGAHGVRDSGLIESAPMRPRNKWDFAGERDLCALAAAYGYGLATNHGYVDGNKRIAFVSMITFLEWNGWVFDAPEPEVVKFMVSVAAGESGEDDIAEWLRLWAAPEMPQDG